MIKKFLQLLILPVLLFSCPAPSAPLLPKGDYIVLKCTKAFPLVSDYLDAETGSKKSWDGLIEYSSDGENWSAWDGGEIISDIFYLRGEGNTKITGDSSSKCRWSINSSEDVYCSGDIVNLLNYKTKNTDNIAPYCFAYMFCDDKNLISAPELSLPELSKGCYEGMFSGCTKLQSAPALPALKTAESCYEAMFKNWLIKKPPRMDLDRNQPLAMSCFDSMFSGCEYLTSAPDLGFKTISDYCYARMFSGCSSLRNPPALPAQTLAEGCYMDMFKGCSNLASMPDLPATDMTKQCYQGMFFECTNIKNMSDVKAKKLADSCFASMFKSCANLEQVFDFDKDAILAESCFNGMFSGCEKLKFSEEKQGIYRNDFYIPTPPALEWEGYMTGFALENMFELTGGDFTGNPDPGVTYFTSNIVK